MNAQYWNTVRRMLRKALTSLSDGDALDATALFPAWVADKWYDMDYRVQHGGKLYKVRQGHTSSALYEPGAVGSEALYAEVEKPGQGDTPDNPIEYNNNMELHKGKYYSQYDVTYICVRSTGVAVFSDLQYLVHNYVEVYTA